MFVFLTNFHKDCVQPAVRRNYRWSMYKIAMVTRYSQTMDINAWPACKCWRFVVQRCSSQAQALVVRPCVSKSDMTTFKCLKVVILYVALPIDWITFDGNDLFFRRMLRTNKELNLRHCGKKTHEVYYLSTENWETLFNHASNDPYMPITRVLCISRVNLKCKSSIII